MKKVKVVLLFFAFLCALSIGIVYFRNDYILKKQEEAMKSAIDLVNENDITKDIYFIQNQNKGEIFNSPNNTENEENVITKIRNYWCYRNSKYKC